MIVCTVKGFVLHPIGSNPQCPQCRELNTLVLYARATLSPKLAEYIKEQP